MEFKLSPEKWDGRNALVFMYYKWELEGINEFPGKLNIEHNTDFRHIDPNATVLLLLVVDISKAHGHMKVYIHHLMRKEKVWVNFFQRKR